MSSSRRAGFSSHAAEMRSCTSAACLFEQALHDPDELVPIPEPRWTDSASRATGFADHAHLSRTMRREIGTSSQVRRELAGSTLVGATT